MGFRIMNRNRQMGIAEFYLFLIFISLSFVSSTPSLHKALSSDQKQESTFKEGKGLHAYRVAKGGGSGGGHASGHASGGHTSPHNGGDGGGESRTPTQGGAAVIPAYVAGAAAAAHGNDHRHRGSTSSGRINRIKLPTLLIITFIYTPLLHMCLSI